MLGLRCAPEPDHVRLRHGNSSLQGCSSARVHVYAGHAPCISSSFLPVPMSSKSWAQATTSDLTFFGPSSVLLAWDIKFKLNWYSCWVYFEKKNWNLFWRDFFIHFIYIHQLGYELIVLTSRKINLVQKNTIHIFHVLSLKLATTTTYIHGMGNLPLSLVIQNQNFLLLPPQKLDLILLKKPKPFTLTNVSRYKVLLANYTYKVKEYSGLPHLRHSKINTINLACTSTPVTYIQRHFASWKLLSKFIDFVILLMD